MTSKSLQRRYKVTLVPSKDISTIHFSWPSTIIFLSPENTVPASTTKPFLFRNPRANVSRGSSVAGPLSDPSLRHACSRASYFAGDRERGWISFRSAGCFRNFRIRADACCFFFFFPFSSSLPLQAASATPALIIAPSTPPEKFVPPLPRSITLEAFVHFFKYFRNFSPWKICAIVPHGFFFPWADNLSTSNLRKE